VNAKVQIWGWFLSVLILAVPAFGQARGFVWEDGELKEVGQFARQAKSYEGEEDSPVAYNIWLGADGNWNNVANWSLGAVPVDTNDVIFNRTSSTSVTSNQDAPDGVDLNSLTVHPLYTGDIGTSAAPLIIDTASDPTGAVGNIVKQGPGAFFIKAGPLGEGNIEFLYIDTDEQAAEIEVDGVINNLIVIKGRVVALSNFDGTNIWVSYRNNPPADAHLTVESTIAITRCAMNGGTVLHNGTSTIANTYIAAGRVIQGLNAGGVGNLAMTGGLLEYNSTDVLVFAYVMGGTLDLSRDGRAKTITELVVFPGGKFLPNANTTITNNAQGSILPIVPIIP